jgi:hypothetical protein
MSRTAAVKLVGFFILHGAGPAGSTEKIIPVTSEQVKRSVAPVIGLVPTSPVTAEAGTSVIPDFVRIAKSPAVLRFTGAGPGPAANALVQATSRNAVDHIMRLVIVLTLFLSVLIQNSYKILSCIFTIEPGADPVSPPQPDSFVGRRLKDLSVFVLQGS